MPIVNVKAPDGSIIKVNAPDGAAQEDILAFAQQEYGKRNGTNNAIPGDIPGGSGQPPLTAAQRDTGIEEAKATMMTGALATIPAGLAGIAGGIVGAAESLLPGHSFDKSAIADKAASWVKGTQEALTYAPRTEQGDKSLTSVAETLAPVTDTIEAAETGLGDSAERFGPGAQAIAHTIPTAVMQLAGLSTIKNVSRGLSRLKNIIKATPDGLQTSILEAGIKNKIPVLTSDLFPPEGYLGKLAASYSEKLGPLGIGSRRAKQQVARTEAVLGMADEMGMDLGSPFAAQVAKSVTVQNAKVLERAGGLRREAITKLDGFGEFQNPRTVAAIDEMLAKQAALGETANKGIIAELKAFKTELSAGNNFSQAAAQRTQLIKKRMQYAKGDDAALTATMQNVKSALDKDMIAFARTSDKPATHKWLDANRKFAEEMDITKRTTMKQILEKGDVTPEKVIPQLKGGRLSELQRLHDGLTEKGRASARSVMIQQALKDSKFFEVDLNPNPSALATAMNKSNFQQAANVFFKGRDKVELDGFTRLLDATRRAQEGQQVLRTGETATIAAGAAGLTTFAVTNPLLALPTLTVASAALKAYESAAFRNILIRLKNAAPGSAKELSAIDAASLIVLNHIKDVKEEEPQ